MSRVAINNIFGLSIRIDANTFSKVALQLCWHSFQRVRNSRAGAPLPCVSTFQGRSCAAGTASANFDATRFAAPLLLHDGYFNDALSGMAFLKANKLFALPEHFVVFHIFNSAMYQHVQVFVFARRR